MPGMTQSSNAIPETGFDQVLGFSLPARDSRGRAVRLGPVLTEILSAHNYPPAIKHCLAEALVVTALMGSLLKGEGDQLTMQVQSDTGLIRLLVCDFRDGALRGYAEAAPMAEQVVGTNAPLEKLFGEGRLAITFEVASTRQRYQGIVPLEGDSLAAAVEGYFRQSEQVPSLVRTAVRSTDGECVAAGLLMQHLAEGEQGRERLHVQLDHPQWEHVAIMGGSISHAELIDPALSLEALLWRLFHEEDRVKVAPGAAIHRGCRCSAAHFESILARFPKEDRRDMANEEGQIVVDCAFCSKEFAIQD